MASSETFEESQLNDWLGKQILQLSIEALNKHMVVCTACGQVKGDYIIDFQNQHYKFDAAKTYAFLSYVLSGD